MATDELQETAGWSRVRIALVVGCVLAAALAVLLVPTLAADDIAGSPIDSVLPGERFEGGGGTGAGSGGGFGALNPGDQTGVGGETGFDSDTFGANDTSVHFEVESAEPAYWRTGSYDTYTGTGWERGDEMSEYDPPLPASGLTDGELEFSVTFAEPATAIPAPYQPREVSDVENLRVTEDGAVRTAQPLDSGTAVSGVSQLQADDVDVLRSAGEDYPEEVTEQYTQLPDETPGRVGAFAEDLTADDETAYDAAMTIQNWLRSEKEYSLQADRQSEHIADTFIFEMEAGYCEYFATAMTTMLRSQDIPARYTVGYTTGQSIGEDTYEVRGMNAHAWVEVYFPDVGWVKFDPTPGGSRLDAQSETLEDELGDEFDLEEPGSPGETFEPGNVSDERAGDDDDEGDDDGGDDAYDISLNRTAVPGLPVEVEVTRDGDPIAEMTVTVNDEEVGTTDSEGTVVFTVPEAEELEIRIQPAGLELESGENLTFGGRSDDEGPRLVGPPSASDGDRVYSVSPDALFETAGDALFETTSDNATAENGTDGSDGAANDTDGATEERDGTTDDEDDEEVGLIRPIEIDLGANTTVDVETDATLSVTGDVFPGEAVTVTATVDGVAIPDAQVSLEGAPVARTDEDGRAEVVLPERAGNATLAVERGSVFGTETVELPELELSVATGRLPLPFAPATAEVSADDSDVAGAPVFVDGERVGTTSADGTVDVRLPLSPSATIEASMYGMSDAQTVDGLLANLAAVVLGTTAAVVVPAVVFRRRDLSLDALARRVRGALEWLSTSSHLALLRAARVGGRWLAAVRQRARTTLAYLFDAVRGRETLADLRQLLGVWLHSKRRVLGGLSAAGASEEADVEGEIQQVWTRFLARVSVSDPSAYTPSELAVHAVDADGLPAEPVETILVAFQAVEYGGRPQRSHLDHAREALARLETYADERQGEPDDSGYRRTRRDRPTEEVTADGGVSPEDAVDDRSRTDGTDDRDRRSTGGSR